MQVEEHPVKKWDRTHPGVNMDRWVRSTFAYVSIHADWAYRDIGILPPRYDGQAGWWL